MSDRLINDAVFLRRPDLEERMPPMLQYAGVRVYSWQGVRVIITYEAMGYHMSVSCEGRDPTWAEIATARYKLFPGVPNMAMYLPSLEDYVNLHPYTFHLYESKVDASQL
ncbi:MAG TPA: hypothetical protein VF077_08980 [Nitrospiraceae bacterium]